MCFPILLPYFCHHPGFPSRSVVVVVLKIYDFYLVYSAVSFYFPANKKKKGHRAVSHGIAIKHHLVTHTYQEIIPLWRLEICRFFFFVTPKCTTFNVLFLGIFKFNLFELLFTPGSLDIPDGCVDRMLLMDDSFRWMVFSGNGNSLKDKRN